MTPYDGFGAYFEDPANYQEMGMTAPEPEESDDLDGEHYVTREHFPGKYGERPEPWQTCYSCACGEDLGFDEEGSGPLDVEAELEKHIENLSESSKNRG